MRRSSISVSLLIVTVWLFAATACNSGGVYTRSSASDSDRGKSSTTATTPDGPPRELFYDEDAGGHTLARHVGKTDDELRDRLMHERIAAASTYTDHQIAEQAIGAAIAGNRDRIVRWISGGGHPNLVLDYDSPRPIGRSLRRGQNESTPCSHAVLVLKWKPPADYFVLTSYPECQ